jgi:hypothetical protein
MGFIRYPGRAVTTCAALLALAACARSAPDEMSWARSALERNTKIEIVATDPQSRTFTVRQKDTGELRMVRADELVGATAAAAPGGTGAATAAGSAPMPGAATSAATTAKDESPASTAAGGAAWVSESAPAAAQAEPVQGAPGSESSGGRVLEAGPGYSIKAATAAPAVGVAAGGTRARDTSVTSAAVERRHEPIICQGSRMLHIDNRNLVFDGDAVSAEDGCEIHITNSHISASGVGVSARAASVHIDNSQIEGGAASIDASQGAQVYAASSRFHGMSRRLDSAAFHDLGGNVWN